MRPSRHVSVWIKACVVHGAQHVRWRTVPCAGLRADGSRKIRPVDHMTQSQVNGSTVTQEKMRHDSLDVLFEIMRRMTSFSGVSFAWACVPLCAGAVTPLLALLVQVPLVMYKADIEGAFRRIPLRPEHRKYAVVAFKKAAATQLFVHMAAPFGAVSSVHHWERVGKTGLAAHACAVLGPQRTLHCQAR